MLFLGGKNTTTQQLAQFVCAAASLVSPPLLGILSRVYPLCSWDNLDFLSTYRSVFQTGDRKGYIAGTKNPLFKPRSNWFDVCCEVETGSVISARPDDYKSQHYYKDDTEFIEYVVSAL